MNSGKVVNSFSALNIINYNPTPSQEQMLQTSNCPFAGQSEILSGGMQPSSSSSDESEPLTGIMMVSVSESSQDYQTPPEHHSRSQNSSNDGHVPPPVDLEVKTAGVRNLETGNDSEILGRNMVDLTNDSDHDDDLGFTEVINVAEDDNDDSPMIEKNDTVKIETGDSAENVVTEAFETELISNSPSVENAHKVFVQMPKRRDTAADVKILNRGKRKLPFTIDSKDQISQVNKGDEGFTGILDRVLSIFGGMPKDDGDIDLIETAKMKGMTFPRPRWWPPQGFKE